MAAKSRKRLSKCGFILSEVELVQLKDVLCSICQSILLEPVTLPCFHSFCQSCFNGSIENNSLCCPLCRLRIGSWLRTSTKRNNLVNVDLWNVIKSKFSQEISRKLNGREINLPDEKLNVRLSEPGEIRSEYEIELNKLREERIRLEQQELEKSQILIKKIQEEEENANKAYLERLKQDELLALQIQKEHSKNSMPTGHSGKESVETKLRLKPTKIDSYLTKHITNSNHVQRVQSKVSPELSSNACSPEMVPSYRKCSKNINNGRLPSTLWNKENGETEVKNDLSYGHKGEDISDSKVKLKSFVQSLPISLPYSGSLHRKPNAGLNRNLETGSVDSMHQELCYFKPIDGTAPTSLSASKEAPIRVPALHADKISATADMREAPTRDQYIEAISQLRDLSLAQNLRSAFVLAHRSLQIDKESLTNAENNTQISKKSTPPHKRKILPKNKRNSEFRGVAKIQSEMSLRRTRSMGSLTKEETEVTPKKGKINDRKVSSDRRPYLRSSSKRSLVRKDYAESSLSPEPRNNNKVDTVSRNLSSPLNNCDVNKILEEQLRIEKIIEQEKSDFELARKIEAELNGRRQPKRLASKRQMTLTHALKPAKKLKV